MSEKLEAINQAYMMIDDIYDQYAGSFGLTDTEIWVLYALKEHNGTHLQTDICREWYYSLQTIHTTIKNMEKKGWIELIHQPGNRKNKYIHLTETGTKLVNQIADPLTVAEKEALGMLSEEEQEMLLPLLQKYAQSLKIAIEKLYCKKNTGRKNVC